LILEETLKNGELGVGEKEHVVETLKYGGLIFVCSLSFIDVNKWEDGGIGWNDLKIS
jgi:hypothetical protein